MKVRDGRVVDKESWLIRPPFGYDVMNEWNTRIHGITAADIVDAPLWGEQFDRLWQFVDGDVLAAHNALGQPVLYRIHLLLSAFVFSTVTLTPVSPAHPSLYLIN